MRHKPELSTRGGAIGDVSGPGHAQGCSASKGRLRERGGRVPQRNRDHERVPRHARLLH